MTMNEAARTCFSKYVAFSGRASRAEFWKFILFLLLVSIVLTIINSIMFGPTVTDQIKISVDAAGQQTQSLNRKVQYNAGGLGFVFNIAVALPFLAVAWRRMHDTGRRGFFVLLPVLGLSVAFAVIYLTSQQVTLDPSTLPSSTLPTGVPAPANITVPGSPGAFLAAWLIAVASFVIVIVWLARASQTGTNPYGPNPHEVPQ